MAARLRAIEAANEISGSEPLPLREVFEACRNGDLARVKKLVIASNVNARDTKGRTSGGPHCKSSGSQQLLKK